MDPVDLLPKDAPDPLGQMLVDAIRERNASLMNNLLRRDMLFGNYTRDLTEEEHRWAIEHIE